MADLLVKLDESVFFLHYIISSVREEVNGEFLIIQKPDEKSGYCTSK